MFTIKFPEDSTNWYSQRIDDEDGKIYYEVHGPEESFIRFEGHRAKVNCEIFLNAISEKHQPPATKAKGDL